MDVDADVPDIGNRTFFNPAVAGAGNTNSVMTGAFDRKPANVHMLHRTIRCAIGRGFFAAVGQR